MQTSLTNPEPSYSELYNTLYGTFPITNRQTRCIKLQSSTDESRELECELSVVDIGIPNRYDAVSYCWGTEKDRSHITVNGVRVIITQSCHDALVIMRTLGHFNVWIDQCSINQQCENEKFTQIGLMAAIYANASSVYAFLGISVLRESMTSSESYKHDEYTEDALQRVVQKYNLFKAKGLPDSGLGLVEQEMRELDAGISDLDARYRLSSHSFPVTEWIRECSVMARISDAKWWTRRFIIQEIARNDRVYVLVGSWCFSLEQLSLMLRFWHKVTNIMGTPDRFNKLRGIMRAKTTLINQGKKHVEGAIAIDRIRHQLRAGLQPDPVDVISLCMYTDTKEMESHIYSLHALLPKSTMRPTLGERADWHLVSTICTRWIIQEGYGPALLSFGALFLNNHDNLPSWTLQFVGNWDKIDDVHKPNRFYADASYMTYYDRIDEKEWGKDPLHNISDGRPVHASTGNQIPIDRFWPCAMARSQPDIRLSNDSLAPECLLVGGIKLDTITSVLGDCGLIVPAVFEGCTVPKVRAFYKPCPRTEEVMHITRRADWWTRIIFPKHTVWTRRDDAAPAFIFEVLLFYLSTAQHRSDRICQISLSKNLRRLTTYPMQFNKADTDWTKRRFGYYRFASTIDGWPAIVPHTTLPGDTIAFFHGVRRPYVLRPCEGGKSKLVGKCHVLALSWWTEEMDSLKAAQEKLTFAIV